jgi:hypothetical protein
MNQAQLNKILDLIDTELTAGLNADYQFYSREVKRKETALGLLKIIDALNEELTSLMLRTGVPDKQEKYLKELKKIIRDEQESKMTDLTLHYSTDFWSMDSE